MNLKIELKFLAKLHYVAETFRTSPRLLVEQQPIKKNQYRQKIEISDFQAL